MPAANADWLLLLHAENGGKLDDNWEAKVETEAKFRDNMSEYYDFEAMPWLACRFTDWFKLGIGWRELYSRNNTIISKLQPSKTTPSPAPAAYQKVSDHYWCVEQRPLVDFMFTMKPGPVTVEERLRVEYRDIEDREAFIRFRNRLRLRPPWKWTKADIQPWVAWEGYYENAPRLAQSDRLNRHRFFLGLGAKLTPRLKTGCYYYREAVLKNDRWDDNNEIGFEITAAY